MSTLPPSGHGAAPFAEAFAPASAALVEALGGHGTVDSLEEVL
ncbi:hypothetical protein [Microbacterium sp. 2RAF4]